MKSFLLLAFFFTIQTVLTQSTNVLGPLGSGEFGKDITILPNGNYVVADPFWDDGVISDVGAVYLYNGDTHNVISTLTGSTTNDQVGNDGIFLLSNGNYIVISSKWNNNMGAVSWGNGATGISGVVNSDNSLVGSTASDQIGSKGITELSNGNYLVSSPNWDEEMIVDVGAVTWGNGTTGITGLVSSDNSLVGGTAFDQVGSGNITVLSNGNYVVSSPNWDTGTVVDAGAATWGDGTTGISGIVSSSNSLVGSIASDQISSRNVTALSNGNYVVSSPKWDKGTMVDVGAVTWGNGTTGISGTIDVSNSLVGINTDNQIGSAGVIALSNGNYVAVSPKWATFEASSFSLNLGAVTWGDGNTGVIGEVNNGNSLVGSRGSDQVGSGGVTALSNGNYVVSSPEWDINNVMYNIVLKDVGAVTWCNGTTGTSGIVSSNNSLIGEDSRDLDRVSNGGVTALKNGNYVVVSTRWNSFRGAVTWGDGNIGVTGVVDSSNSLVGNISNDQVGSDGITELSNGNYVVTSVEWNNGSTGDFDGAVTWGNGATGISGVVSSSNSLIGNIIDQVGIGGVIALSNGNYVVNSWRCSIGDDDSGLFVGAVTWGDGTTGISGMVGGNNSLIGDPDFEIDLVGRGGVVALSNGNYS